MVIQYNYTTLSCKIPYIFCPKIIWISESFVRRQYHFNRWIVTAWPCLQFICMTLQDWMQSCNRICYLLYTLNGFLWSSWRIITIYAWCVLFAFESLLYVNYFSKTIALIITRIVTYKYCTRNTAKKVLMYKVWDPKYGVSFYIYVLLYKIGRSYRISIPIIF